MEENKWDLKDQRHFRAMCVSYAKDLVIAGKIGIEEICNTSQKMFEYIWDKKL